jgi:Lipoprotein NlpI, contains TPR repeats
MTHRPKLRRFGRLAASAAFTWLIAMAAAKAQTPDLDACGRAADNGLRIKACSAVIGAPGNPPAMIAWAYANRCQALENSRKFDAAIADCSQALKLDPNMANAYNLRGFAYYAKGDSDRALADYGTALRLAPDNAYAHAARGHIYLAKRDYAQRSRSSTRPLP